MSRHTFRASSFTLGLGLLITAAGCNSRKLDYSQIDTSDMPSEQFSVYRKRGDSILVSRITTGNATMPRLVSYVVWEAGMSGTQQRVVKDMPLGKPQVDSLQQIARKPGSWTPLLSEQILFVQIRPTATDGGDFKVLLLRQEIEGEIDNALRNAGIGFWTAGDLGPGGGNMLFSTTDANEAHRAILTVLRAYQLEHNTVVARQIVTGPDEWQYEVYYPTAYSGAFNSM